MSRFDSLFGLPAARLKVVTSIASSPSPWLANGEEVLDAENVHAVAPDAAITVVLVKATSLNNPANAIAAAVAAIRVGVSQGSVISISAAGQTGGEHCDTPTEVDRLNAALQAAAARHVTVIAASGDIGAVGEPCAGDQGPDRWCLPSRQGGQPAGRRPARPCHGRHQPQRQPHHGRLHQRDRMGPPVRQPRNAVPGLGRRVQPPLRAARLPERRARHRRRPRRAGRVRRRLTAHGHGAGHQRRRQPIHDPQQRRHQRQRATLGRPDRPGRPIRRPSPRVRQPRDLPHRRAAPPTTTAFHDITTGNNTPTFPGHTINGYTATPGWDPVTGWGSPNAQALIPLLARYSNQ